MNTFVLINGILYCMAAVWSAAKGNWPWAAVWVCYGVSAFILGMMEGK